MKKAVKFFSEGPIHLSRLNQFINLLYVFDLLAFVIGIIILDSVKVDPLMIVTTALGLLAFVAIFYSLVISSQYQITVSSILKEISHRRSHLEEEKTKIRSGTVEFQVLSRAIEEAETIEQNLENIQRSLKLDIAIWLSSVFFILGVFLAWIGKADLSSVLVFFGAIGVIHIITLWMYMSVRYLPSIKEVTEETK